MIHTTIVGARQYIEDFFSAISGAVVSPAHLYDHLHFETSESERRKGRKQFFCAYATLIHQAPGIFDWELVIFFFFNSVKCYPRISIQYRETKHRNIFIHLLFVVLKVLRCETSRTVIHRC